MTSPGPSSSPEPVNRQPKPRRASIDDAIMVVRGLDAHDVTRVHGRLILGTDGLYFIHGWEELQTQTAEGGSAGGLLGVLLGSIWSHVTNATTNHWIDDASREGARQLAGVAKLGPEKQLACIPGSIHVPLHDIERVRTGAFGVIRIVTATHGDEHMFIVPRPRRATAKRWVLMTRNPR